MGTAGAAEAGVGNACCAAEIGCCQGCDDSGCMYACAWLVVDPSPQKFAYGSWDAPFSQLGSGAGSAMCAMAAADGTAGGGIAGKAGKAGIVCSPVKKETSDDAPANMSGASPNGMAALGEAANGISDGAGSTPVSSSAKPPVSSCEAMVVPTPWRNHHRTAGIPQNGEKSREEKKRTPQKNKRVKGMVY